MGNLTTNQVLPSGKEKDICVFFSFDMVGSTKFKTKREDWSFKISSFYYTVYRKLHREIPQIKVWKYLGDEILLYASISDFDFKNLIKIPKMVYDVQSEAAKKIQEDLSMPELDVKSTVWIAGVQTIESRQQEQFADSELDKNYKNIGVTIDMEAKEKTEEKKIDDFLGPDMDIGFRVAKFAFHHKVVLSADFAYLLHEIPTKIKDEEIDYKIDDDLQIVSYEILKGVWNEQYYPIVWYFPDWKSKDLLFFYDDHKKNPIVDRVLSGRIDPIDKLTQVYKELGKTKEIDAFVNECISCLKQ